MQRLLLDCPPWGRGRDCSEGSGLLSARLNAVPWFTDEVTCYTKSLLDHELGPQAEETGDEIKDELLPVTTYP